jgi:hypothetical protein
MQEATNVVIWNPVTYSLLESGLLFPLIVWGVTTTLSFLTIDWVWHQVLRHYAHGPRLPGVVQVTTYLQFAIAVIIGFLAVGQVLPS